MILHELFYCLKTSRDVHIVLFAVFVGVFKHMSLLVLYESIMWCVLYVDLADLR